MHSAAQIMQVTGAKCSPGRLLVISGTVLMVTEHKMPNCSI